MSKGNVERMRQSLVAFDQRDRAAWLALRDPDVEVVPTAVWPETGVIVGHDAAWEFYVAVADTFEPRAFSAEAVPEDAGPGTVLVHQRHEVRGRASGARGVIDFWALVTFRGGMIVRDEWFADHAEALAAARQRSSH